MNKESILQQFALIESSIDRAKIPFAIDLVRPEVLKVTIYECLKAIQQAQNIIDEIRASDKMLSNEQNVQVSDTTDDDSSNQS